MVADGPGNEFVEDAARPDRRVVLLGASNLARGISTIVESAQQSWGAPLDFVAALGHGRSFGLTSQVLGRKLPGIDRCAIWNELQHRPQVPTAALVTDIGNDILYGAKVGQITDWVRACMDRLAPACEQIVVTQLPLTSLERLGDKRFALMRTLLFPESKLSLEQVREAAKQLNNSIVHLAKQFDATLVVPRSDWYGFDPIHIRMKYWRSAWQEILSPWTHGEPSIEARGSLRRWIRLRVARQHERTLFGIHQKQSQPAITLNDGTTISYY